MKWELVKHLTLTPCMRVLLGFYRSLMSQPGTICLSLSNYGPVIMMLLMPDQDKCAADEGPSPCGDSILVKWH